MVKIITTLEAFAMEVLLEDVFDVLQASGEYELADQTIKQLELLRNLQKADLEEILQGELQ